MYLFGPFVGFDGLVDCGAVGGRGDLQRVELPQEVVQALRRRHLLKRVMFECANSIFVHMLTLFTITTVGLELGSADSGNRLCLQDRADRRQRRRDEFQL